jgi:hypothetical protein
MTCPEARELLSALLDEALSLSERQAIEAHLAACAECQRELAELRETVALLNRLPPAHAPAGFVDRVVERAYRPSWPRRVADAVFRPLRVKLPLEAAAVVLVGISALYVYQRAPEVREVARQEPHEPSVASSRLAAPPAPSPGGEPSRAPGVSDGAPAPQQENVAPRTSASSGADASVTGAAPPPEPQVAAPAEAKKEVLDQRREDPAGAPAPPGIPEKPAQSAEPAPSRDAAGPPTAPVPAPPRSAAAPPEVRSRAGAPGTAPSEAPAAEGAPQPFSTTSKSRAAAKLTRAVDASGRLAVAAPEPAEIALDALLGRLGGTRVARRIEGPAGPILVDVIIPAARYPELLEGLRAIGRWTTEHEPPTLPAQVRVEIAVSAER